MPIKLNKKAKNYFKTGFIKPYITANKTNLAFCQNYPGVYLIKKDNEIVYVGYSYNNVYRTLTRHFQSWNDKKQYRATYRQIGEVTVRVVITDENRVQPLEIALRIKYKPVHNEMAITKLEKELATQKMLQQLEDEYFNAIPINKKDLTDEEVPF